MLGRVFGFNQGLRRRGPRDSVTQAFRDWFMLELASVVSLLHH